MSISLRLSQLCSPRTGKRRQRRRGDAGHGDIYRKDVIITVNTAALLFQFTITAAIILYSKHVSQWTTAFTPATGTHTGGKVAIIGRGIQNAFRLVPLTLHSSNKNNDIYDMENNDWTTLSSGSAEQEDDWQKVLLQKQDGSFWSSFEPSADDTETNGTKGCDTSKATTNEIMDDDMIAEMWIDQLQALASKEVEFNMQEADRADKVRQMEEYGFDREIIQNALGVAMDTTLETLDEVKGMQNYREESFWDDVDLTTVESHSRVEKDAETLEPTRLQMVYVDEHTCIGCTNCAMIAQSTFFMHPEHGRARVFQQWGDTDETIQIAIETCPVDCIHYVPYDELVSLEIDRRDQNINFKARLVSQAENGNTLSHLSGRGPNAFTAPQRISGNMKARCNNCPSRGCRTCPMFGVGKNPAFEAAEQLRKEKMKKRQVQQQRERDEKSIEL